MKFLRIVGCLLALTGCLWADNATVAAEEIPLPAKDAILGSYPKAMIISAEKKVAGSETIYAVRFKVLETVRVCEVTPDGIIKKIEDTAK